MYLFSQVFFKTPYKALKFQGKSKKKNFKNQNDMQTYILKISPLVALSQVARNSSDQDGKAGFTKSKKHYCSSY